MPILYLRPQSGFSLVELMIALLLGLTLLTGVLNLFLDSRQSDQLQAALTELQENGRFALDSVAHTVRMAGSGGCMAPVESANALSGAAEFWPTDLSQPIRGLDNREASIWGKELKRSLRGSDALIINWIDSDAGINLSSEPTAFTQAKLPLQEPHSFKPGTLLLLQDRNCYQQVLVAHNPSEKKARNLRHLEIRTGTISRKAVSNCSTQLAGSFDCTDTRTESGQDNRLYAEGRAAPLVSTAFYLRPGSDGQTPGLYRRILNGNTEELVGGIEDLQLRYGIDIDQDGTIEQLLDANQVKDWRQVQSVEIHVLARSSSYKTASPQRYHFFGQERVSADRYLRQGFSQSVFLRGQRPGISSQQERP